MATLYVECRALLLYVACRKFGVPEEDAESLLHDAVLSLLTTTATLENPRAWLVAAVANASRAYRRSRARYELIPQDAFDEMTTLGSTVDAEQVERKLTLSDILRHLHPRYREMLRLHYLEQLTSSEIADRLGSSTRYAEKRIVLALRRVREAYTSLTKRADQPSEVSKTHPG